MVFPEIFLLMYAFSQNMSLELTSGRMVSLTQKQQKINKVARFPDQDTSRGECDRILEMKKLLSANLFSTGQPCLKNS